MVNAMHSCVSYSGLFLSRCVVLWLLTGLVGLDVSSAEESDLNGPATPSVAALDESSDVLIAATPRSGANKSTDMTNSAIGRDPTDINVTDPVSYYAKRVRAIQLVKDEYWQEAMPFF